ncbi:uncharacterized protein LOC135159794 isoform X2 [Diachasmimorpha longicaudata]|uniref:uncharacterized protein LOC135159794 isoform X2 n=1 Tax=Diachasmimorpha longicaudata TaxID=58733 RepID=UPI0030B89D27
MIRLRKTNHNHYEIKGLFSQAGGPLDDKDDDRISTEVDESSDTGDKENVKKQRNKRSDGERKRKQIVADSSPEMEIEKSSKLREERRKVVSDSSPEEFVKHQGSTEIDKEMEIARSKSSTSKKTKTQGLLTASSASNITNSDQKVVGDHDVTDSVDVQPSSSRRRFDCEKRRSTSMMDDSPQSTPKSSHASIVHTPATFPRIKSTVALAQHLPNSDQDSHQLLLLCLRLLRNLTSAVGQLKGDMVQMREDWSNDRRRNVERQVPLSGNLHHHYCDSVDKFNQFNNRLLREQDFRNTICARISSLINVKKSLSKNIGFILKPLMTKELLQHYTAQKKTGDKLLFTTLPIWSCIKEELKKEASKKKIPEYKDAELLQGLGGTINNCRSWKKNNEDHNDNNGRDEEAAGGNVVEDGAQNADD